jgi:hypothetical protein
MRRILIQQVENSQSVRMNGSGLPRKQWLLEIP